ncbi:MAG: hypothetical protein AB1324_08125 [Candidatus Micrarchaeota archaeon]
MHAIARVVGQNRAERKQHPSPEPLAETIRRLRPGERSLVILGNVPDDTKSGAWRLAAIERGALVERLSRTEVATDPNRCLLHSEDYSLQLAIRIPPLSGKVVFETFWYPPALPAPATLRLSLAVSGSGGALGAASDFHWPVPTYEDFLRFAPSVPLHALRSVRLFEICAAPAP